jgi:ComF family protein
LQNVYAASVFNNVWRSVIHAFKYNGQHTLAGTLAAQFPTIPHLPPDAIVAPVPLHPNRRRWRGYDQAALLAEALAERLGLTFTIDALARVRDTRPQVGLNKTERQRNVEGAFRADSRLVEGRPVVLVDDVFTTGATLAAGAAALHKAGAAKIWAVALACADDPRST